MLVFPLSFNVAGVTFEGRQKYIHELDNKLKSGSRIKFELVPEPSNPFDSNAIKVLADNVHIGYVPATLASFIFPIVSQLEVTMASISPTKHTNAILYVTLTVNKKQ